MIWTDSQVDEIGESTRVSFQRSLVQGAEIALSLDGPGRAFRILTSGQRPSPYHENHRFDRQYGLVVSIRCCLIAFCFYITATARKPKTCDWYSFVSCPFKTHCHCLLHKPCLWGTVRPSKQPTPDDQTLHHKQALMGALCTQWTRSCLASAHNSHLEHSRVKHSFLPTMNARALPSLPAPWPINTLP